MILRELTATDAVAFRDLRIRGFRENPTCFGSSAEEMERTTVEAAASLLRREGRSPDDFVLGAFLGETLVGMAGLERPLRQKRAHRATLWGMVVAKEARRRGTGRLIVQGALERARALPGLSRMNLTVMAHNEAAVALYRSFGFEVWGEEQDAMRLSGQAFNELSMGLVL